MFYLDSKVKCRLGVTPGTNTAMLVAGTVFTLVGKIGVTGAFSSAFVVTPELYPTNLRSTFFSLTFYLSLNQCVLNVKRVFLYFYKIYI